VYKRQLPNPITVKNTTTITIRITAIATVSLIMNLRASFIPKEF